MTADPRPNVAVWVREFQAGDEAAFRRLNEEWIVRYFKMEPKDEYAFDNPRETVLDRGGRIFFAVRGEECVGCCALLAMRPHELEIAKMAVTASAQGLGVGRKVLQACVDAGRAMGAKRLYLETNHVLTPAIHLYEAVGFKHLPSERVTPSPYARADVFMEMWLLASQPSGSVHGQRVAPHFATGEKISSAPNTNLSPNIESK